MFALIHRLIASHQHSNRIPGILRVDVGVGVGVGVGVDAGAGAGARRACSRRQFVDIKQREQHLNKFTQRLTGYCAIEALQS